MLTHGALLSQSQLRSFPFLFQGNGLIVMEKVGAGKLHPVRLHGSIPEVLSGYIPLKFHHGLSLEKRTACYECRVTSEIGELPSRRLNIY